LPAFDSAGSPTNSVFGLQSSVVLRVEAENVPLAVGDGDDGVRFGDPPGVSSHEVRSPRVSHDDAHCKARCGASRTADHRLRGGQVNAHGFLVRAFWRRHEAILRFSQIRLFVCARALAHEKADCNIAASSDAALVRNADASSRSLSEECSLPSRRRPATRCVRRSLTHCGPRRTGKLAHI
jgi:hypothetical protein